MDSEVALEGNHSFSESAGKNVVSHMNEEYAEPFESANGDSADTTKPYPDDSPDDLVLKEQALNLLDYRCQHRIFEEIVNGSVRWILFGYIVFVTTIPSLFY